MKEIAYILLGLATGVTIYFFIIKPLAAIWDLLYEIRKLRESVGNLSEIIKNIGGDKDAEEKR